MLDNLPNYRGLKNNIFHYHTFYLIFNFYLFCSTGSSSTSPNVAMRGLGLSTGTEDDLPKSIIVTNVEQSVFDNPQLKVTKMYIL